MTNKAAKKAASTAEQKRALLAKLIKEKQNKSRIFPASFAQKRLWLLDQITPDSDFYNLTLALELQGDLKVEALNNAFNQLIKRHQTLRTTFTMENDEPAQLIHPATGFNIAITDLTTYKENEQSNETKSLLAKEAHRGFNLETGPLFRVKLIRLDKDRYILVVTFHHIITDGWSNGIFTRELSELYRASISGESAKLPELEIQYADFALWQKKRMTGNVLATQLDYWKKQLEKSIPLDLPTDRARASVQTFNGALRHETLSIELTSQLRDFCQLHNVSLYMTMLACFNLLLQRYTSQDDISVGTPVANRNRAELENIIGFFINSLVIRTALSGNPDFLSLLNNVKETTLSAFDHQDIPFEKLVEELQPERNPSMSPLFQVIFTVQNAPAKEIKLPGLSFRVPHMEIQSVRFDMEVYVWEQTDTLTLGFIYNTDLFDATTIERMMGHYQQLLHVCITEPLKPLSEYRMLGVAEQEKILYEWNHTQQPFLHNRLVHQSVEKMSTDYATHTAIVSNKKSLDYATLNHSANQLAHYLIDLGANAATPVTVLMNRTADMIIALLAILKTGSHYVPVDPEYPEKRLAYILDDTKSNIIITQSDLASRAGSFSGHVVCFDDIAEKLLDYSEDNPDVSVTPDHTAYIIYTSGSTGKPKGVEITHAGLSNLVAWHQREYQPGINDRASHLAGLGFDASVWEIWPYISCGTCLYLVPDELRLSASGLWQWLVKQGITLSFMPTPLAEAVLAEITPDSLTKPEFALRVLLTGGDKLHGGLSKLKLPFRIVNHYGPTENTVVATCVDVDVEDEKEPSIGRPIDNVQTYILDRFMQPVPVGVTGNLYVGGNSLAKGYINQETLNTDKFVNNPFSRAGNKRLYNTGDLAKYREDGLIEFAGRSDSQVKLRGFRIELGEIEEALNQQALVRNAVVLLREDESGNKRLVAYIVVNKNNVVFDQTNLGESANKAATEKLAQHVIAELSRAIRRILPKYMVPSAFIIMDDFPLTPNGKIDRKVFPVPDETNLQTNAEYIAPGNDTEISLAEIWSQVLKLEKVGIHDNFFDLGGHSLLATQVVSRIRQTENIDIPVASFFENPTISGMADYIETTRWVRDVKKNIHQNTDGDRQVGEI